MFQQVPSQDAVSLSFLRVKTYLKVQNLNTRNWAFKANYSRTWPEHLWDHGNIFETWVVRATEG